MIYGDGSMGMFFLCGWESAEEWGHIWRYTQVWEVMEGSG